MKIIGLTGSIGAGKSTITQYLAEKGAYIICADKIARDVVRPGTPGHKAVKKEFGDEYFLPDGQLDRKKLGKRVFSDPAALAKLNAILHPLIAGAIAERIKRCRKRAVVVSAALLIEAGWDSMADEVWLVRTDDAVRLERLVENKGMSRQEALSIMHAQMPQEEKKKHARIVIDNSSTLEDLYSRIDAA
ncbi:MAG: dephospho-CoA kinase, partial [Bacillota bacterium]|nr:dephospho-CoA kinase [Bacillota bacterium]